MAEPRIVAPLAYNIREAVLDRGEVKVEDVDWLGALARPTRQAIVNALKGDLYIDEEEGKQIEQGAKQEEGEVTRALIQNLQGTTPRDEKIAHLKKLLAQPDCRWWNLFGDCVFSFKKVRLRTELSKLSGTLAKKE